jgi:hypothetical protein
LSLALSIEALLNFPVLVLEVFLLTFEGELLCLELVEVNFDSP